MLRPGNNPYNNCVVYSDFYYITPYNQYKVLDTLQCPDESKYIVRNGNKSYCIYDCKKDEIYKYLYNGECLKECPENTINKDFICNEILDQCNLGELQMDEKNLITQESTEILVKTYISEFNYTDKHITLHNNKKYSIIIYKNRDCILELSLEMPKVDFKECYDKVKSIYHIEEDLIIVIIDKKDSNNNKGQTYYSFFHPLSGFKLDAEGICKNETIAVTQNLTSILSENEEKYELQTYLTEQGINIFNMDDPFYTDLCFDFDNPFDKDIPLSERITIIYPDVSLCDDGCQMEGINIENMTALCNCKFNDISNNNIIKDNPLLESVAGEVFDFIDSSNILVMKCYKYIFNDFTSSIGGILSLVSLGSYLACSVFYFIFGKNQVTIYVYNIYENFLTFLEKGGIKGGAPPKRNIKNENLRDRLIKNKKKKNVSVKFNEEVKENKSQKYRPVDTNMFDDKRKIKIEKPRLEEYDVKSTYNELILYRTEKTKKMNNNKSDKSDKIINREKEITDLVLKSKNKNINKNIINNNNINSSTKMKKDLIQKISVKEDYKNFFDEYLSTSLDDLEYDDALIKDKRTFCEYLAESLKEKQMITFTFCSSDPLKIRVIKIMIFILNFILYFVVIGLFYNEEYISTLFYLEDEDEHFFSYISRSIDKFIYTALVGVIIGYLMDCFFVDEKKIKAIFRREKDNLINLKSEIIGFINSVKNKYLSLIITILVILLVAAYYLLCFNYVYPKTQIEWVKASVTIFIIMQILSVLKCVLQTSLRFLSFKCNSEKLYKVSKLLD